MAASKYKRPRKKRGKPKRRGNAGIKGVDEKPMDQSPLPGRTGCLSGDTKIYIIRDGKESIITIREAYHHWIGESTESEFGMCRCGCRRQTKVPTKNNKAKGEIKNVPLDFIPSHRGRCIPWDLTVPVFVKAYDGNTAVLAQIINIIPSGMKDIHWVKLESGHRVKCSLNQDIMTDDGWICPGNLAPNTKIMIYEKPGIDIDFENMCTVEKPVTFGFSTVSSVSKFNQEEPTYEIITAGPYDNFVIENGIIVRADFLRGDSLP